MNASCCRILDALNLTYSADAKAFEAFTRDDDAVDMLKGLDAKIRFFESATRNRLLIHM